MNRSARSVRGAIFSAPMNADRIGANAFLLIGLSALSGGAVAASRERAFQKRARHTRGTVLTVNEGRKPNGETFYVAIVRWIPPDGVPRTFNLYPQRWGDPAAGATLDLLYDPANPQTPVAPDAAGHVMFFAILGGLGVGFTTIGARVHLRLRREARRAR